MSIKRCIYHIGKKVFGFFGFAIAVAPVKKTTGPYEPIMTASMYAPWLSDEDFQNVYQKIRKHTLVDIYRCYELRQLTKQTNSLEGNILEVGVRRGGTGSIISTAATGAKDTTVYLADTFEGVVKTGVNDNLYVGGEHNDTSIEIVTELLNSLGIKNTSLLPGIFPDDTGDEITNEKFRLCHIDVDVYQSAADIVDRIWPKLVSGGIIVFDDYGFSGCKGVAKYVDEQRENKDLSVIYNINGHGIIIKR